MRIEVGMSRSAVLSQHDLCAFQEQGYVRLPDAFPANSAIEMQGFLWQELKRLSDLVS